LLACACNGFLGVVQLFVQTAMASTFAELMPADVRNLMAGEQSIICYSTVSLFGSLLQNEEQMCAGAEP
jgi:hypothetical protein